MSYFIVFLANWLILFEVNRKISHFYILAMGGLNEEDGYSFKISRDHWLGERQ